jgi:L-fucose mutarotase
MLKGIDRLLHAELLSVLCAMGHGDEIVIADSNFPADSVASSTRIGKPLRLDGAEIGQAMQSVLSVFPLDTFVATPVLRMEVVGDPAKIPVIHQEVQAVINASEGRDAPMGALERMAFYERAKTAYCIVATGEQRFYGCFILKKGVLPEPA